MAVEMIDGRNLSLGPITHETKMLTITIGSHNNKVVFKFHLISNKPYHH